MQPGVDYIGVNVGFICHDGRGNILLHLRSDKCRDEHNTWDAGGGKIEFGETPEEAVVREVMEECGCQCLRVDHVAHLTLLREHQGQKTHWIATIFAVRVDPSEVKVMEPDRNLGNQWYELQRLPEPLHSVARRTLEKHKETLLTHIYL